MVEYFSNIRPKEYILVSTRLSLAPMPAENRQERRHDAFWDISKKGREDDVI